MTSRRSHRAAVIALLMLVLPRCSGADPRPPEIMDAAGIRLAIQKLNVVGSALYIAAHPDDENTAMITWLAKGRLVRAGYLSLTRGDGGQNLLGSDTGEKLGVIRTQELVGARRIDSGEQYFSRALDFGFSKGPDETLAKWGHERILGDVVWVIRSVRPDVIITRFPTDGSGGHGHHTASALLAEEAFVAAADPKRFPEQLTWVSPWQAKRLVWNAFRFGNQGPDTTSGRLHVDLGEYAPLLGRAYTEIAGDSRSMHKSQGFGSAERRGRWINSFEHRLGSRASVDLFDGVDLSWSRIAGATRLTPIFDQALHEFRPEQPDAVVPTLLRAYDVLATLPDEPIVRRKRDELLDVIRSCTGLWLEAIGQTPSASPGSVVRIVVSALNRSAMPVGVDSVVVTQQPLRDGPGDAIRAVSDVPWVLARNVASSDTIPFPLSPRLATSESYWLSRRALSGSFEVDDPALIGRPENVPRLSARFHVSVLGRRLTYTQPVVYRWTDPVLGERYRDLSVVPPVSLRFDQGAYLFPDLKPRELRVVVQSSDQPISGVLSLALPNGWSSSPEQAAVALRAGEADTTLRFMVTPAAAPVGATVAARLRIGEASYSRQIVRLDYSHIPIQTLLPPAEAHLVRTDLRVSGSHAGYVMGSGDQVPEALRQMGFAVTLLSDDDIENQDLARYDAIVIGVRAYNTRPRLKGLQRRLLAYANGGGRLVLQYDTADEALDDRLGPFPFKISRDRVTVEEAPVRLLNPQHPLLTTPNRIVPGDFDGWVQERGLYFANPWDPRYETVLSCNDPNEPARDGGLLVAHVGKGTFIYSGYAWFRQLPAGVPGAWRLFANLVSAPARKH